MYLDVLNYLNKVSFEIGKNTQKIKTSFNSFVF